MRKTMELEVLPPAGGRNGKNGNDGMNGASWERARELWERVSPHAEDIIELGRVILVLREEYFNLGRGGDHKSAAFKNQTSAPRMFDFKGWHEEIKKQLGLTPQRALRLLDRADGLSRLVCISEGEDCRWSDKPGGEMKETKATPEAQRIAAEAIPDVVMGLMNPRRAWAGVCGESAREAMGKHRTEVDHGAVLMKALRSLRFSTQEWEHIAPAKRHEIESLWDDVRLELPTTWRAHIFNKRGL